jgi:hypothetical protein
LSPEIALSLPSLLNGLLVPLGLGPGLATRLADALGCSQHLGQARLARLCAGSLCPRKQLGHPLV